MIEPGSTHHDPGTQSATSRAAAIGDAPTDPVSLPNGNRIRVGTAGWTDKTLLPAGLFYPDGVDSAEDRLRYYASRFPLVEVDSSYYGLPVRRNSELWAARTPDNFKFDIKAYALMTATRPKSLASHARWAKPACVGRRATARPSATCHRNLRRGMGHLPRRCPAAVRSGKTRVGTPPVSTVVHAWSRRTHARQARDRLGDIPCHRV